MPERDQERLRSRAAGIQKSPEAGAALDKALKHLREANEKLQLGQSMDAVELRRINRRVSKAMASICSDGRPELKDLDTEDEGLEAAEAGISISTPPKATPAASPRPVSG